MMKMKQKNKMRNYKVLILLKLFSLDIFFKISFHKFMVQETFSCLPASKFTWQ